MAIPLYKLGLGTTFSLDPQPSPPSPSKPSPSFWLTRLNPTVKLDDFIVILTSHFTPLFMHEFSKP